MTSPLLIKIERNLVEVNYSNHVMLAKKSKQIHYILGRNTAEKVFLNYVYKTQHVRITYRHGNYVAVSTSMPISLATMKKLVALWANCTYHLDKYGKPVIPNDTPDDKWYWC